MFMCVGVVGVNDGYVMIFVSFEASSSSWCVVCCEDFGVLNFGEDESLMNKIVLNV